MAAGFMVLVIIQLGLDGYRSISAIATGDRFANRLGHSSTAIGAHPSPSGMVR